MRVLLVPMSLTVPMFAMLVSLARADREMQWADSARSSADEFCVRSRICVVICPIFPAEGRQARGSRGKSPGGRAVGGAGLW